MQCKACGGPTVYVNGGQQCTQCTWYEPGYVAPDPEPAPPPPPPAPTVIPGEPPSPTAALLEGAAIAEDVEQLGHRVVAKLQRDARSQPDVADVERLGREWMEIVDDAAGIGRRAKAFFGRLGRQLRG